MRNLIYLRPKLYDLSQGTRIKLIRVFRHLTQDNISDDLGITGENKRRTLTRYEKGDRNPSKSRLQELSKILLVNDNLINQEFLTEFSKYYSDKDELYKIKTCYDKMDDTYTINDVFN